MPASAPLIVTCAASPLTATDAPLVTTLMLSSPAVPLTLTLSAAPSPGRCPEPPPGRSRPASVGAGQRTMATAKPIGSISAAPPAMTPSMSSPASHVAVNGLAAQVTIKRVEAGPDTLAVNGRGGNDTIDASESRPGQPLDQRRRWQRIIIGSAGNDAVNGGRGNEWQCSARATTRSSGIPATAATPSKDRPAPTPSSSTARSSTRRSTSRRPGVRFTRDIADIVMDLAGVETST